MSLTQQIVRTLVDTGRRYLAHVNAGQHLYIAQNHLSLAWLELRKAGADPAHVARIEDARHRVVKALIDLQRDVESYQRLLQDGEPA